MIEYDGNTRDPAASEVVRRDERILSYRGKKRSYQQKRDFRRNRKNFPLFGRNFYRYAVAAVWPRSD